MLRHTLNAVITNSYDFLITNNFLFDKVRSLVDQIISKFIEFVKGIGSRQNGSNLSATQADLFRSFPSSMRINTPYHGHRDEFQEIIITPEIKEESHNKKKKKKKKSKQKVQSNVGSFKQNQKENGMSLRKSKLKSIRIDPSYGFGQKISEERDSFHIPSDSKDIPRSGQDKGLEIRQKQSTSYSDSEKEKLEKRIAELEEKQKKQEQFYENQIKSLSESIKELTAKVKTSEQFFEEKLFSAAKSGQLSKIKMALEMDADIHAKDTDGETPIFHSVLNNHRDVSIYLLEKGAHLETQNIKGLTILHKLAEAKNLEMVEFVLERFPTTDKEAKILFSALEVKTTPEIRKSIANKILFQAAKQGSIVLAEQALAKGADINAQDDCSETALHKASYFKEAKLVDFLLSKRANILLRDRYEQTPYQVADIEIKKIILEYQNKNAIRIQAQCRRFFTQKKVQLLAKNYKEQLQEESVPIFADWAVKKKYDEIMKLADSLKNEHLHQAKNMMRGIPEKEMKSRNGFLVKY